MGNLVLRNISKDFVTEGRKTSVIKNISLEIPRGSFITFLGPTGCGKTTLLKLIAGFLKTTRNEILIDGKKIERPGLDRVMIFQNDAIFPWLTVRENIEFPLKNMYCSKNIVDEKVDMLLSITNLMKFANYYPKHLSGGMKKRVDIARAFAVNPPFILADEPFSSLDTMTKFHLYVEVMNIWMREKNTIIFVTHDVEEAIFLSGTIYLLSKAPTHILKSFKVPFSYPRNISLISSHKFQSLRKHIMATYYD